MTLKEIPVKEGEQLVFRSIELAEKVRALDRIEQEKKEANEEWAAQIKLLKKAIVKLAYEMKE